MYCYGHFYKLRTTGNRTLCCRSVLEITTHQYPNPNVLLNRQPDAIVVMMNPGSSRPRQAVRQHILDAQNIRTRCVLIPARHDNTQNQIMEIMRQMHYNHIRVLNLSDIREPKSKKFFQLVSQGRIIQNNHIQTSHSIFSQCRSRELRCRMNPRSGIVIAGWGYSWKKPRWRCNFAKRCYDMICAFGFHIIGYQNNNDRDHNFVHPYYKPIMNIWPQCIVSQIRQITNPRS